MQYYTKGYIAIAIFALLCTHTLSAKDVYRVGSTFNTAADGSGETVTVDSGDNVYTGDGTVSNWGQNGGGDFYLSSLTNTSTNTSGK